MDSKKTLALVLATFLLPLTIWAGEADYLFVSLDYDYASGTVTAVGAEQRVVDSSKTNNSSSGDFELILNDTRGLIERVVFRIPEKRRVEIIAAPGSQEGTSSEPKIYSTTLALPVTKSLNADEATLEIRRSGQILFSKKLSEIDLEIVGVKNNSILVASPEISLPPLPGFSKESPSLILITAGLLIVLFVLAFWRFLKKRKNSKNTNYSAPASGPESPV